MLFGRYILNLKLEFKLGELLVRLWLGLGKRFGVNTLSSTQGQM